MPKKTGFRICLFLGIVETLNTVNHLTATNIYAIEGWESSLVLAVVFLASAFFLFRRYKDQYSQYQDEQRRRWGAEEARQAALPHCACCGVSVQRQHPNNLCDDCARLLMLNVSAVGDLSRSALDTVKDLTSSGELTDSEKNEIVDKLSEIQTLGEQSLAVSNSPYNSGTEATLRSFYDKASRLYQEILRYISRQASPDSSHSSGRTRSSFAASVITSLQYAVAGVTFANEDGSSRQQILRDLCGGEDYGEADAQLVEYSYKGSPAIRVDTELGCVGNVRKSDIPAVLPLFANGALSVSLLIESFEGDKGETIYRADIEIEQ